MLVSFNRDPQGSAAMSAFRRDTGFDPPRALPAALLDRWRSALPHARVVELPEAGHWPHEEQPDPVAQHIAAFAR